jgi:hypothetical protein
MEEIRSSWEIAREKADKLGELSPEEQRKQREDRCRPIGKALAEKYLGECDINSLEAEINEHGDEDKELIRQMVLYNLVEHIDLKNDFVLERICRGILALTRIETADHLMNSIQQVFQQYREAQEVERQKIEKAGGEILHQQRISGTAVSRINIRAREEWREILDKTAQPFEESLGKLKKELLE